MSRCRVVLEALKQAYPEIRSTGFAETMRNLFPDDLEVFTPCPIVPDAYAVHPELREIDLIEIVDTHPISAVKGQHIYEMADALHGLGWSLNVIVYDSEGQVSAQAHGLSFMPFTVTGNPRNVVPAAVALERSCA